MLNNGILFVNEKKKNYILIKVKHSKTKQNKYENKKNIMLRRKINLTNTTKCDHKNKV